MQIDFMKRSESDGKMTVDLAVACGDELPAPNSQDPPYHTRIAVEWAKLIAEFKKQNVLSDDELTRITNDLEKNGFSMAHTVCSLEFVTDAISRSTNLGG